MAWLKARSKSNTVDAKKLLKESDDNTIVIPFFFDKNPDIGLVQEGDLFFACISVNELNPPEGTECEHRITSPIFHVHNIAAK